MPPIIIYSWFLISSIAAVKASLKPSDVKVAPATKSKSSNLFFFFFDLVEMFFSYIFTSKNLLYSV